MKPRFRLIRRGERSWKFYCVDARTGLATADEDEARQMVLARNRPCASRR